MATFGKTTMTAFDSETEGPLHGSLHSLLGGVWGCTEDLGDIATVHPAVAAALGVFIDLYYHILTSLTASLEMNCPAFCSRETPFEDCRCACPLLDDADLDLKQLTRQQLAAARALTSGDGASSAAARSRANNVSASEGARREKLRSAFHETLVEPLVARKGLAFVERAFAYNASTRAWGFRALGGLSDAEYEPFEELLESATLSVMCSPGKSAPYTSPLGSANDPAFWPVHTTFERNWAYVRRYRHFNNTWANTVVSAGVSLPSWGFHAAQEPFGRLDHRLFDGMEPPGGDRSYTNAEVGSSDDVAHHKDLVSWRRRVTFVTPTRGARRPLRSAGDAPHVHLGQHRVGPLRRRVGHTSANADAPTIPVCSVLMDWRWRC
jgi:hypothetical protein